jgi:hypothetical protein
MKKAFYTPLMLLIVCTAIVSSCSKSSTPAPAPSIVGNWALTSGKVVIVTPDTTAGVSTPITTMQNTTDTIGRTTDVEFLSTGSFTIINTTTTPYINVSGIYTVSNDTLTEVPSAGPTLIQEFTVTSTTLTTTYSTSTGPGQSVSYSSIYTRQP